MDNYIEIAVPRKNSVKDTALCFAFTFVPLIVGTYLFITLLGTGDMGRIAIGAIICGLLYYFAFKVFGNFSVEWEYTLVGNEIRFSKIMNKDKRRDLMTISLSKTDIIARTDDNSNNHQFRTTDAQKCNYTSQTDVKTYYMIGVNDKGKKVCIVFEPDDRMIDNFKTTLRGKFFE